MERTGFSKLEGMGSKLLCMRRQLCQCSLKTSLCTQSLLHEKARSSSDLYTGAGLCEVVSVLWRRRLRAGPIGTAYFSFTGVDVPCLTTGVVCAMCSSGCQPTCICNKVTASRISEC